MKMQLATKMRLRRAAVWIARIVLGATFILSGWAKSIDPWGFIIKMNEYLTVWGLNIPREATLTGCVALSCVEFATGILLLVGALKRTAALIATALMAVMLPLTLYIALKNPVADCGCFGDFIVISNWSTFWKNVVLTALAVYLLLRNRTVRGLYAAPIQWLVVTVSLAFPLFLAVIGYNVQPLVDFRPYRLGTELFAEQADGGDTYYIYEKDGERRQFDISELPDSTWAYVDAITEGDSEDTYGFEVRDSDGYSVNSDLADTEGASLYLIVAEPDMQFLSRSHFANRLSEYAAAHGVRMTGIVGASADNSDKYDYWVSLTRPHFPVYSAEDTSLKQLVRGDAALVYTVDGKIMWKRTLASMDSRLPEEAGQDNALDDVFAVDDGRMHFFVLAAFLLSMLVIYLLSLSPKILRFFVRHTEKNA